MTGMRLKDAPYSIKGSPDRKSQSPTETVSDITKGRVALTETDAGLLERVDTLATNDNDRFLQTKAYQDFGISIRKGQRTGIFKLPTGVGKTRIFSNLLRVLGKNGLILVPRVPLYESTKDELLEAGFTEDEIKFPHEEEGANAEEKFMSLLTDPSIDWSSGHIQVIMTYQSLVSMVRKNPIMTSFIREHFGVIIEDEAHRGLGDKTRQTTDSLMDDEEQAELEAEEQAEEILGNPSNRYHYYFTATPDLIKKSVTDNDEYITFATIEEAVRTGAIVLPQFKDVGAAYTKDSNLEKWKSVDIEKLSEGDKFVDEDGRSIRTKIIEAYQKKKEFHNGKLPAVAFASTIEHARQIVEDMEKSGIRATRVTSAPGDVTPKEAIQSMDAGKLDVIVTVEKVAEGFNYPPLSCAMWLTPVTSSAKMGQGNGRIMRWTPEKASADIIGPDGRLIPSPNTYIIAPSVWYGCPPTKDKSEEEQISEGQIGGGQRRSQSTAPRIGNFYEVLLASGEINMNSLPQDIRDMVDTKASIVCESGEEKTIDGVVYVGVTRTNEVLGVKGQTILKRIKRAGGNVSSLFSRQRNGSPITLVPKAFIESLVVVHACEPGEEKVIDGIAYIGVTHTNEVFGVKGQTIIKNLAHAENSVSVLLAKQKNGLRVNLIPRSFIENFVVEHTCEPGEEKVIDDTVYVGVTNANEVLGMRGQAILKRIKRAGSNIPSLSGRQGNRYPITLVPKSFVESLFVEHTCEPGEEQEIDGTVYIGVVQKIEVLGLKGFTILNRLSRADPTVSIPGKQKNGLRITLVSKSFIESLVAPYVCEPGEEKEIDGVVYIGVVPKITALGVKGQTILQNLKRAGDSVPSLSGHQKNGFSVTLAPRSFIEHLLPAYTCEPGEEKTIDGIVYIGVTQTSEAFGIRGFTILNNLKRTRGSVLSFPGRQKNGKTITLIPKSFIEELTRKKQR